MALKISKFAIYSWIVLGVNIFVIIWGAYVRASGSGAGCGSHWPTCNGAIIPLNPRIETVIEFTHRLSSGFALILVIGMLIWAYRSYPRKNIVRLGATLSMIFITTEALVGAGLVLFEWVAQDASTGRVISMAVHLINTFLLLAALTLTAWWASSGETISLTKKGVALWVFTIGFIGVLFIGVSGAITALGDTLFPASSLAEGMQQDFSAAAHFVVRLRIWHPIIAIITGAYLFLVSGLIAMYANDELRAIRDGKNQNSPKIERHYRFVRLFAYLLIGGLALQLLAGLINLVLLAPVWMQLVHLFLADTVWIFLVLLFANTFAKIDLVESVTETQEGNPEPNRSSLHTGSAIFHYTSPNVD